MLSLGPLLSDLAVEPVPSVAARFWPIVLGLFFLLGMTALIFALRGVNRKKEEDEEGGR